MKSKSPSWPGKATVHPRSQGRRCMAFTEAKRKPLTEEADGSGAEFGQEGNFAQSCLKKNEIQCAVASPGRNCRIGQC